MDTTQSVGLLKFTEVARTRYEVEPSDLQLYLRSHQLN